MLFKNSVFVAAAVAVFAVPAAAVTINFEELAAPGDDSNFVASPYSTMGFTFTSTGGVLGGILDSTRYSTYGTDNPRSADPGGAVLISNRENAVNTLTMDGGALFDLNSIDLAGTTRFGTDGGTVRFYANDDASDFLDLTFDSDLTLTSFDLPFMDVSSVSFFGIDTPFFQIDNVVLNEMVADVPEPAALGLLGLGILGLAAIRRRA